MNIHAATCLAALIVALSADTAAASKWKYGKEDSWPAFCRAGEKQSPIALSGAIAKETNFNEFIFEHYQSEFASHLINNGQSAEIRFRVTDQPNVKGGGLPNTYVFDHLNFHWESEHTISDFRFPLELQLVHYANLYNNLTEALLHKDGVAAFSVLFDYSIEDADDYDPLMSIIDKLHDKVNKAEPLILKMAHYIPENTGGFFRYVGSLTTPDCTEGVLWTVFLDTLPISERQVKSFQSIKTIHGRALEMNYRSLQPLHYRDLYVNFPTQAAPGRSYVTGIFWILLLCLVFL